MEDFLPDYPPPAACGCSAPTTTYTKDYCENYFACTDPPVVGGCYFAYAFRVEFDTTEEEPPPTPDEQSEECGSIVKIESRSIQENIPIIGMDLDLVYSTKRVIGRKANVSYSLTLPEPDNSDVTEIFLIHTKDGTASTQSFSATGTNVYNYTWNGLNASNQEVIDGVDHLIEVEYEYNNSNRVKIIESKPRISFFNAKLIGLGGFTLSNMNFLSIKTGKIHYGDGKERTVIPIKINKTGDVISKLPDTATTFSNYLVASQNGTQAFIFDLQGYHIETRSARSSKILTRFTYNSSKKLTKMIDAYSNETLFSRPNSTTVQITTPFGKITTINMNSIGFATEVITPNNEYYTLTYSLLSGQTGLLTGFEDPKGKISAFTYDADGFLTEDLNNAGQKVELNVVTNEKYSKLIHAISAEGRITKYYTDFQDTGESITTITKPSGHITVTKNENLDNEITNPDGSFFKAVRVEDERFGAQVFIDENITIKTHNVDHQLVRTDNYSYSEPDLLNLDSYVKTLVYDNKTWETSYNGTTKTLLIKSPLNQNNSIKYNDYDQITESKFANFSTYEFDYDTQGRLSEVTNDTRNWDITYNSENEVSTLTNPLNEITAYLYDSNGRVIETTHPNNEKTYFEYDELGNIKKVKGGTQPWHEYVRNLFGGVVEYVMPILGGAAPTIQYEYNDDKQLTRIIRENTDEIIFDYDTSTALLKLISTTEGNYVYSTNPLTEQVTQVQAPNGTKIQNTYQKDEIQIHRQRDGVNNSTYTYAYAKMQPSKRTIRHIDSDSDVNHFTNLTYNNDRLLRTVGALTINRTSATGLVSGTSLTGGVTESYFYDSNYPEIYDYYGYYNGAEIYRQLYQRDALGRTTMAYESNSTYIFNHRYYGYDSRGRLSRSGINFPNQRQYYYDSNSNRIRVDDQNDKVREIGTYNNQDQLLTYIIQGDSNNVLSSYSYTYDDFGHRLTKTEAISNIKEDYSYNTMGALVSYVRTDLNSSTVLKTITYKNDAYGRRITKTEDGVLQTRYIYDETIRLVGEVSPDGSALTHYIYGDKSHVPSYMHRGGINYKFITNEQGSVRHVVNATTGDIEQDIIYNEFGLVTEDSNPDFQPFGFAGGIYDSDTNLTRFGVRDYDAETGRWTAKDPILFEGGDSNLYGYTFNDPVNLIDPNGEYAIPLLITLPSMGPLALLAGIGTVGYLALDWWMDPGDANLDPARDQCTMNENKGGHTKNKRPSTEQKHQEGDSRRQRDKGGEKGDKYRRPPKQRPDKWKGPFPPKS